MSWESFYLLCFLIGLGMSGLSFLLGSLHIHLPHIHLDGASGGHHAHFDLGHVHAGPAHGASAISPINFSTLMAFLAWFGGAGYLLTRYSQLAALASLAFAVVVGLAGGAIVFWFMAKVLYSADEELDPADYEMVGTLGKLTVGIRPGGTGEILYVQGGTRKSAAARSEAGVAIEKGTEVVVTSYDKGIAYVRRWDELAGDAATASSGADHN